MLTILAGVFLVLHGLVHLLYAGQSARLFELSAGLTWPDGSWLFSRILGDAATRWLAVAMLAITALLYMAGGAGLFFRQEWWRTAAVSAAALSTLIFVLFWDGRFQALDARGGVGLLISAAILFIILILKWRP